MNRSKQIVKELDKFSIKREERRLVLVTMFLAMVFGMVIGLSI